MRTRCWITLCLLATSVSLAHAGAPAAPCAEAQALAPSESDDSATVPVSFAGVEASPEGACGSSASRGIWFAYTPPRDGAVAAHLLTGEGIELAVYDACGGALLKCYPNGRPNGPDDALIEAAADVPIFIRLGADEGNTGDALLRVEFLEVRAGRTVGVPGDDCGSATPLEDQIPLQFTFAGLAASEPEACVEAERPDAWFAYTAPGTGALYVQACNFELATTVTVYGTCGAAPLLCLESGCPADQQQGFLRVVDGETYLLRVTRSGEGDEPTTAVLAARFAGEATAVLSMTLPEESTGGDDGSGGIRVGVFDEGAAFTSDLKADLRGTSLGGFRIRIEFNPLVARLTSVEPIRPEFSDYFEYDDSMPGAVTIASVVSGASIGTPTGSLSLARVGFEIVGIPGDSSSLRAVPDIDPTPGAAELFANDALLLPIPVVTEPVLLVVRQTVVAGGTAVVMLTENSRFPGQAPAVSGATVKLGTIPLAETPPGSGVYTNVAVGLGFAALSIEKSGYYPRNAPVEIFRGINEWPIAMEPLETSNPVTHNADRDADSRLALGEVLRLIQLYNAPRGYYCAPSAAGTDDGYVADPGIPGANRRTCSFSTADYEPLDWRVSLSELLRQVQFFNVGGMRRCGDGSGDGLCAGL